MCVRECTPVSTTFGSLSLVTGSSGFGHKVVHPFWKRGSVYGLETSRSLEGGCFWHCLGLVILFFFFFFFTSGFEKVFYDLSDYDLVCVFFFSSFYSFVADDNYIGTCISGDLNIFLFFFFYSLLYCK